MATIRMTRLRRQVAPIPGANKSDSSFKGRCGLRKNIAVIGGCGCRVAGPNHPPKLAHGPSELQPSMMPELTPSGSLSHPNPFDFWTRAVSLLRLPSQRFQLDCFDRPQPANQFRRCSEARKGIRRPIFAHFDGKAPRQARGSGQFGHASL